MSTTFALVCMGLITLALWIGLIALIVAFLQMQRTLRAVEVLAYQLRNSTEKLNNVSIQIHDFADSVRSGWMKALELVIGAVQTFWTRRPEAERQASSHRKGDGRE